VSLPRFFAGAPEPGETVVLDSDDAQHAIRSLRLRPGSELTSSDGRGAVATCRIVRAERLLVEAEVIERTEERPPVPRLTVLLAPPKGDRLSWAVQKLTEVGADEIVLLEAARSVRRWKADRGGKVGERLDAVAREAAKQSRRAFLPRISGPEPWEDGLAAAAGRAPVVVLWERAAAPLSEVLRAGTPEELAVVVGPEGGIPEEDARSAERAGAVLASLGSQVLRTETAAVVGAVLVLARYGRLG
jgi:16S rRNA (uracil1498-N3)-methyltransferase